MRVTTKGRCVLNPISNTTQSHSLDRFTPIWYQENWENCASFWHCLFYNNHLRHVFILKCVVSQNRPLFNRFGKCRFQPGIRQPYRYLKKVLIYKLISISIYTIFAELNFVIQQTILEILAVMKSWPTSHSAILHFGHIANLPSMLIFEV